MEKLNEISQFVKSITLHFTPSHVNIIGNELADGCAKQAAKLNSLENQNSMSMPLTNLKTYLKKELSTKWYENTNKKCKNISFRQQILCDKKSNLKSRIETPRSLQTLFSRHRCDRSESVGKCPRKLGHVNDPSCRLCGHPEESINHLLTSCTGTLACRNNDDLSSQTLVKDSPSSMLKIAYFDTWIRRHMSFDSMPPEHRIQQSINLV